MSIEKKNLCILGKTIMINIKHYTHDGIKGFVATSMDMNFSISSIGLHEKHNNEQLYNEIKESFEKQMKTSMNSKGFKDFDDYYRHRTQLFTKGQSKSNSDYGNSKKSEPKPNIVIFENPGFDTDEQFMVGFSSQV